MRLPSISKRAQEYKGSPIRRIASLLEKASMNKDIISFGGGAPSLAPPQEIIEKVIQQLKEQPQLSTAYCSTEGLPRTRELISEDLKRDEGIDISPDEISITIGGTEALYAVFQTILNPGDEVITTDPTYLCYEEPMKLMGARQVRVPVYWREDFQFYPDRINEKITSKTKAVILLSPDNPTGAIQSEENVKGIVELCEDHDLWLITDDIYKDIVYEGKFVNSRKFGGYENTITTCSFSKTASIPGVRIGYAYGPKQVISKLSELKQATTLTAPRLAQYFVQALLEDGARVKHEYLKNTVIPTYKARRDAMARELKEQIPELEYSKPKGAFYFFIDMSDYIQDDVEFSDKLFKEKSVVVIPGSHFGENGKKHVRMTFVSETEERIKQGISKIREFIQEQ